MHIIGNAYPSYYLTLTPGAEVTIETPSTPAGQPASTTSIYVPPIASSETTSISEPGQSPSTPAAHETATDNNLNPSQSNNAGPSSPTSTKSSGENNSPSTTSRTGPSSSGTPRDGQGEGKPDSSSESSASLSRSDQIAIGIGIGLGFPTVLIGVLTWFYPRHRLQIPRRQASTKSRLWPRRASATVTSAPPTHGWEEIGAAGVGVGGGHGSTYVLTPLPTRAAPEIITSRVDLNRGGSAGVP